MGRTQKDALLVIPKRPQSPWEAADINKEKLTYPSGILTLECTSKQSPYHIARSTLPSGSWSFRSWFLDQENSIHSTEKRTKEKFLIARSDEVCWKPLQNGVIPKDSIRVAGKGDTQKHAWIGKHIDFGIGPVEKHDDKFFYIRNGGKCNDDGSIDMLCKRN